MSQLLKNKEDAASWNYQTDSDIENSNLPKENNQFNIIYTHQSSKVNLPSHHNSSITTKTIASWMSFPFSCHMWHIL